LIENLLNMGWVVAGRKMMRLFREQSGDWFLSVMEKMQSNGAMNYSNALRNAKHTRSTSASVITPENGSAMLSSPSRSVTGKSPG
jgi:hypothetical protein